MNDQQKPAKQPRKKIFTRANVFSTLGVIGGFALTTLVYSKANLINAQAESYRSNIEYDRKRDEREEKRYARELEWYNRENQKRLEAIENAS